MPRDRANGAKQLRQRHIVEGRITHNQVKGFAQPLRTIDVVQDEPWHPRKAVVYIEDSHVIAAFHDHLAQQWRTQATWVVERRDEVRKVVEGRAVKEVLLSIVLLVHHAVSFLSLVCSARNTVTNKRGCGPYLACPQADSHCYVIFDG